MSNEVQKFIEQCKLNDFPMICGAEFLCIVGDKCYYSNDNYYTFQEVYDNYTNVKSKEEEDWRDWELFMEIDEARENYLDMYGHI